MYGLFGLPAMLDLIAGICLQLCIDGLLFFLVPVTAARLCSRLHPPDLVKTAWSTSCAAVDGLSSHHSPLPNAAQRAFSS